MTYNPFVSFLRLICFFLSLLAGAAFLFVHSCTHKRRALALAGFSYTKQYIHICALHTYRDRHGGRHTMYTKNLWAPTNQYLQKWALDLKTHSHELMLASIDIKVKRLQHSLTCLRSSIHNDLHMLMRRLFCSFYFFTSHAYIVVVPNNQRFVSSRTLIHTHTQFILRSFMIILKANAFILNPKKKYITTHSKNVNILMLYQLTYFQNCQTLTKHIQFHFISSNFY